MIDEILEGLSGDSDQKINDIDDRNIIDPEALKQQMESLDEDVDKDDSKNSKVDDGEKPKEDTEDVKVEEEISELDEDSIEIDDSNIPVIVEYFSDKFAEELGWEFEEGQTPTSMEGLVKYMQNLIETNSKPQYSNDDVKNLDEYVSNGGSLKTYFESLYNTQLDLDNVDLSKEHNQKAVIRENLKNKGYSGTRIEKLINKYEDTDILEEEALDSYEEVKEYRAKVKQDVLEDQRKQTEEMQKQQTKFVNDVQKIIEDTTEIAGVKLSASDKKELVEYIFKPTSEGITQFQKDYNSNLKHLVDSAFFTKKGDKLVQQIEKKAATTATRKLTLKLKTSGKSTKNTSSDMDNSGKVSKLWDIASSAIKSFE